MGRGDWGGFFPSRFPPMVFLSVLLRVGGGKEARHCIGDPLALSHKGLRRSGLGTGTIELPAAGGLHINHQQKGNGGWATREVAKAVTEKRGEGYLPSPPPKKKKGTTLSSTKGSFANDN